jgi:hypothetical protein
MGYGGWGMGVDGVDDDVVMSEVVDDDDGVVRRCALIAL